MLLGTCLQRRNTQQMSFISLYSVSLLDHESDQFSGVANTLSHCLREYSDILATGSTVPCRPKGQ